MFCGWMGRGNGDVSEMGWDGMRANIKKHSGNCNICVYTYHLSISQKPENLNVFRFFLFWGLGSMMDGWGWVGDEMEIYVDLASWLLVFIIM